MAEALEGRVDDFIELGKTGSYVKILSVICQ